MAVPKAVRDRLLARLESLIAESQRVLDTRQERMGEARVKTFEGEVISRAPNYEVVDMSVMVNWTTKCVNVLNIILPRNSPNRNVIEAFQKYRQPGPGLVHQLVGQLSAVRDDFRDGFLDDAWSMLVAEVSADYLAQSDALLQEGYYVPAAVLAGAVLEASLRTLCDREDPPISTVMPNGRRKTLSVYIDDLKKAGVYNEARAKELRAWSAIRNHAAHGEFDQFSEEQVSNMLAGIQSFLAEYVK